MVCNWKWNGAFSYTFDVPWRRNPYRRPSLSSEKGRARAIHDGYQLWWDVERIRMLFDTFFHWNGCAQRAVRHGHDNQIISLLLHLEFTCKNLWEICRARVKRTTKKKEAEGGKLPTMLCSEFSIELRACMSLRARDADKLSCSPVKFMQRLPSGFLLSIRRPPQDGERARGCTALRAVVFWWRERGDELQCDIANDMHRTNIPPINGNPVDIDMHNFIVLLALFARLAILHHESLTKSTQCTLSHYVLSKWYG